MERLRKLFGNAPLGGIQDENQATTAASNIAPETDTNNNFQFEGSTDRDRNNNFQTRTAPPNFILSIPFAPEARRTAPAPPEPERRPAPQPQIFQLPSVPEDAKVTDSRVGQMMESGREMLLKVVPLREGDCLSCKLIGTATMFGAAAFVLFAYPKGKLRFTGYKRKLFAVQVISLATGMSILGTARFLDLGLFAPPDENGQRKTLMELVDEDLKGFARTFSNIFPASKSDSSSNNKSDS